MKVFASIMAFIVLFLSVQPAFALFDKMQKTECCSGCSQEDNDTPKQEQPAKNNPSNNCNPFQSCGACIGYTVGFPALNVFVPVFKEAKLATVTQQVYSQFSPDFWQPPKIA